MCLLYFMTAVRKANLLSEFADTHSSNSGPLLGKLSSGGAVCGMSPAAAAAAAISGDGGGESPVAAAAAAAAIEAARFTGGGN